MKSRTISQLQRELQSLDKQLAVWATSGPKTRHDLMSVTGILERSSAGLARLRTTERRKGHGENVVVFDRFQLQLDNLADEITKVKGDKVGPIIRHRLERASAATTGMDGLIEGILDYLYGGKGCVGNVDQTGATVDSQGCIQDRPGSGGQRICCPHGSRAKCVNGVFLCVSD